MSLSANEDHNLRHLQAQMARIDVLVRRQVLLWQRAGQDPAEAFRGLHVSDAKARLLSTQPFGGSLSDGATQQRRPRALWPPTSRPTRMPAPS
jgi:hypothetical protein